MAEDIVLPPNKTLQSCMQSLSLKPERAVMYLESTHKGKQNAQVGKAVVLEQGFRRTVTDAERRELGYDITHLQNHKGSE